MPLALRPNVWPERALSRRGLLGGRVHRAGGGLDSGRIEFRPGSDPGSNADAARGAAEHWQEPGPHDEVFAGPFNSESYVYIDEVEKVLALVREVWPKSVIAAPTPDDSVPAGTTVISGFAWSGYAAIATVEVSADDGASWAEAELVEEAGPTSWVRFEYEWDAQPGEAVLTSRATDQRGLTQPITDDWNANGFLMNAIYHVPVTVG